jgi:hypothetical protein|tara:strand:- start:574 stop:960 length:387 start_codon:yes stop_codon:yes gene_type:complete
MIKPGTILKCTDTQDPSNTFTMTYLSGYIDVTPEKVWDERFGSHRYEITVMFEDGFVSSSVKLWIHTDGRMCLSTGWWVEKADTQNHLLRYLMNPENESTRVRTLIEWLDCGLVELDNPQPTTLSQGE